RVAVEPEHGVALGRGVIPRHPGPDGDPLAREMRLRVQPQAGTQGRVRVFQVVVDDLRLPVADPLLPPESEPGGLVRANRPDDLAVLVDRRSLLEGDA